ncbi:Uma2 family endonuclease [Dactylosporangium sp. NPDC051541]|uniref:Uma2 family endonuclease n=1 Tax=Dactylosporangium sp. NPDC051541 TaxID=3363977 RepID=UPI0037A0411E
MSQALLLRPPPSGCWTIEDVVALDEVEGLRFELHEGVLLVLPLSWGHHAVAVSEVQGHFFGSERESFFGIGIGIGERSLYLPDITVLREGAELEPDQCVFSPAIVEIVVEVVQQTSEDMDRLVKPLAYARAGVPHFWRVERTPESHVVWKHDLRGGAYQLTGVVPIEALN